MLFNSLEFIIFFPIVVLSYYFLPDRWRWILLLVSSYYFYMCWKPEYVIVLMVSTLIDFFAGQKIYHSTNTKLKKTYLIVSLILNLGLLFTFKYYNFFNNNIHEFLSSINIFYGMPYFELLLPVGISFYTFQSLSYIIDLYRGNIKPANHLGIYALYVSFFPQLVAGPIERAKNLLPQFTQLRKGVNYYDISNGLKLILWGFFKKVVIADNLSIYVNIVYAEPSNYNSTQLIAASVFFAFQIYCDFSGYSDIAIGSAKILGYDLMENFRRPYFSSSVVEFWKRWHISLSTWFKDYLYIPLGGNRTLKWKWYYNLFITFLISGFWHGANWTFIVWGTLHGLFFIIYVATNGWLSKVINIKVNQVFMKTIHIVFTFSLVTFAWIFFRAENISDAVIIVKGIFAFNSDIINLSSYLLPEIGYYKFPFYLGLILLLQMVHFFEKNKNFLTMINSKPLVMRWSFYYSLVILILVFGIHGKQDFIYFQF